MKHDVKKSAEIIAKDFDIGKKPVHLSSDEEKAYEELKQHLADRIAQMIDHSFDKLVNILYRIDVSEEKFKAVLKDYQPPEVPEKLAELIIERHMQKLKWRKKFQ